MGKVDNHGYTMTVLDYLGSYKDGWAHWAYDSDEQFDCIFEVFNLYTDTTEQRGDFREIYREYWGRDCEVHSLDIPKFDEKTGKILICININEDWNEEE